MPPPFVPPSGKELHQKVCAALSALKAGRVQFEPIKHLVSSLETMDLEGPEELVALLIELLTVIKRSNRLLEEHYAGARPPHESYEKEHKGHRLWAFKCFAPSRGGQLIYLKFVLKQDVYFHISCHEDDP
jgi:hypothetical protein